MNPGGIRTRAAELVAATTLLTRLPVGGLVAAHPPPASCVWAYPLVGALVGLAGAATLAATLACGLPQPLGAIWALAVTVLLTGGLHEDGLADTADGFGGGRTVARKLDIMRDSRIGSFGALALLFSLLLRATALALSPHPVQAIVLAAVLGRGAIALPLLLLRPARSDGLAHAIHTGRRGPALAALAITALAGARSPAACLAALAASLAMTAIAARHVRGYTGDTLGATEQAAECCALCVLAV